MPLRLSTGPLVQPAVVFLSRTYSACDAKGCRCNRSVLLLIVVIMGDASLELARSVQAACFADDIEVEDVMATWSQHELQDFFDSGGQLRPSASGSGSHSAKTSDSPAAEPAAEAPSATVSEGSASPSTPAQLAATAIALEASEAARGAAASGEAIADVSDAHVGTATADHGTAGEDDAARAADYEAFKPRFALGRGQFGIVYLMQHADGRQAVDKRVDLSGLSSDQRTQTHKEIDLLRRLAHEHVVSYYHSYESDDAPSKPGDAPGRTLHILMEYCDGGPLDEEISQQKNLGQPFSEWRIRSWVWQLATALEHIHSKRVQHASLAAPCTRACRAVHGAPACPYPALGEARTGAEGVARARNRAWRPRLIGFVAPCHRVARAPPLRR